jgi:hypothetical protein
MCALCWEVETTGRGERSFWDPPSLLHCLYTGWSGQLCKKQHFNRTLLQLLQRITFGIITAGVANTRSLFGKKYVLTPAHHNVRITYDTKHLYNEF